MRAVQFVDIGQLTFWDADAGKTLRVEAHRVTVGCQSTFGFVEMAEFLEALASKVKANGASADAYKKLHKSPSAPKELGSGGKLRTPVFYHHIQVTLAFLHMLEDMHSN